MWLWCHRNFRFGFIYCINVFLFNIQLAKKSYRWQLCTTLVFLEFGHPYSQKSVYQKSVSQKSVYQPQISYRSAPDTLISSRAHKSPNILIRYTRMKMEGFQEIWASSNVEKLQCYCQTSILIWHLTLPA